MKKDMSVIVKTNDLLTDDLNIATIDLYSDLTFLVSGLKGDKGDKGDRGFSITKISTERNTKVTPNETNVFIFAESEEGEKFIKMFSIADGQKGDRGLQGPKGDKGDKGDNGDIGYSIKAVAVYRNIFTDAQWKTYGTIGHYERWSNTSSKLEGMREGDIFLCYGNATDSGVGYLLLYKFTTPRYNMLYGQCLASIELPKGEKGDAGTTDYNELINKPTIPTKVSQLDNDSNYTTEKYVDDKIAEVETFKTPNITIYGQPIINNGQISNFSATNYAQFPFMVNFQNRPFNIHICLTTSNDITTQQNVFDSRFGLAFAIRDKHLICAYSTNGTSWESELIGSHELKANTTYYINLQWRDNKFEVYLSEDRETYLRDIEYSVNATPASKQIIIGKDLINNYIFGGIVNLNYCYLTIGEELVWQGMDDVGLSTRLATDLSNIDDEGIEKIKEISKPCFHYFAKGDGTTAGKWHATIPEITEYYEGLTILLYLNVAGATTTTLQVNDLDAVPCFLNANTALQAQYVVGSIIPLTWIYYELDGVTPISGGKGAFKIADYNTTYNATIAKYWANGAKIDESSTGKVEAYNIFGFLANGNVCQISNGNVATTKIASTNGFDLDNYSLYLNKSTVTNNWVLPTNAYDSYTSLDSRYIVNKASFTLYSKSYLVFTKGDDGLFYFNKPTATTIATIGDNWWWNDAAQGFPKDETSIAKVQGLYFFEIGMHHAGSSNRTISFASNHHIYYYDADGNVKIYK